MNNLCADIGFSSLNKYGEQLCGDRVQIVDQDENSKVIVLADGLGSGVKANILSTLTSKIISTMMANSIGIEECVSTLATTLPVSNELKVAYSTFTIIRIVDNKEVELIQFDNPQVILLRNGKNKEYNKSITEIDGKTIYQSKFMILENDILVTMSDGVLYASEGLDLNYNWKRSDVIDLLEVIYNANYSAKNISNIVLDECNKLYNNKPGDDTTVCTIKIMQRKQVNLLIGPPSNRNDVNTMMALFFSKEGKHIVCGGTTSTLAADFLGKKLRVKADNLDPDIPPISEVEGIDLVTEGVLTINRVLTYAQNYLQDNKFSTTINTKRDGASLIAKILFEEATDINFFVGKAVNQAQQDYSQINFTIKMRLVEELAKSLKQMGKQIKLTYF